MILGHLAHRLLSELDSPESVGWGLTSIGLLVVVRWRQPGWCIGLVGQLVGLITGHLVCLVSISIYLSHLWRRRHEPFLRAVPPIHKAICSDCCVHGRKDDHEAEARHRAPGGRGDAGARLRRSHPVGRQDRAEAPRTAAGAQQHAPGHSGTHAQPAAVSRSEDGDPAGAAVIAWTS